MEQDKITFNQQMDNFITAVASLTQEQIDALAYVMGAGGCGWNKQNITAELQAEKHN